MKKAYTFDTMFGFCDIMVNSYFKGSEMLK